MRQLRAWSSVPCLALVVFALVLFPASRPALAEQSGAVAQDARLAGDRERTRFIADLSKKVDVNVFALGDPYRVIVDAADVSFQMPEGIGNETVGLVTAFRYGLFAQGKSRIVLDLSGPFLIDRTFVLAPRDDQPARLVIDLVPTDEETFLAKLKEQRGKIAEAETVERPAVSPPPDDAKPVVVLDPGHGGVDPGAKSAGGVQEKEVVLAFAKRLKAKLEATDRYQVFMTREDDTFLPLKERVSYAQKKGAGLFVSLHADYFPTEIDDARGATVFTLSEEATDDEARALAAKENFSDAIAGVELPKDSDEVVTNILIDLAQRETNNRSAVLARSIVGELAANGRLHTKQLRSAGFRVLKAPDVPSVLVELGFLSNEEDEKQLTSDAWRDRMAVSITAAIDNYFAKRIARAPF
ncbi:N-acetylmuramoyl-L-alanine amidase [Methyloceanibacter sp.]|uniref:N-acetylmuramoyl-L-alanine amidase n=1 Tax=Methyloceanibacter sp. TaxID=1965321 RepID=UPI002D1FA63B|nr:N-acetylmuramoyl-L-alanine amidase [Methyloceanibacter sp.]